MMPKYGATLLTCLLLLPTAVSAQVLITEVMYAPKSTDDKHEWVEVCNAGSATQSIEGWVLHEDDTDHGLQLTSGSWQLTSAECAIIADDASTFEDDYPTFSGTLIDSSFTLNNTGGDTIILKDSAGSEVDTVAYSDADGAKDDGNSLHISNGELVPGEPTPGEEDGITSTIENTATSSETTTTTTTVTNITQYTYEPLSIEPPQDVYLRVPEEVHGVVGAPITLYAEMYDARGRTLAEGVVHWSFGDGTEAYAQEVKHTYHYSGEYLITVSLESGALRDEAHVHVVIESLDAAFSIDEKGEWVAISNNSSELLDVSNWRIRSSGRTAILPEGTMIAASSTVRFATDMLKLPLIRLNKEATLLFPDGSVAVAGVVAKSEATTSTQQSPLSQTVNSELAAPSPPSQPSSHQSQSSNSIIGTSAYATSLGSSSTVDLGVSINRDMVPTTKNVSVTTNHSPLPTNHSDTATSTAQLASAAGSRTPVSNSFWWYLALIALILTGAAGMLLARRSTNPADEFTIIEKS